MRLQTVSGVYMRHNDGLIRRLRTPKARTTVDPRLDKLTGRVTPASPFGPLLHERDAHKGRKIFRTIPAAVPVPVPVRSVLSVRAGEGDAGSG
jgi:hypothetical protein